MEFWLGAIFSAARRSKVATPHRVNKYRNRLQLQGVGPHLTGLPVFRDLEAFPRMGTPPSGVAAGNAKKGKFRRVKMNSKLLGRSVGRLGAIGYWRILHGLSSFVYM